MIVVRNVFQLKFGKAREALAVWKDGRALFQRLGMPMEKSRILTDVVGPFYTMVLENTFESLTDYERAGKEVMGNEEWRAWYARLTPLCEGGHREIFSVVE
jgi:predicted thioredoxin/glutaredoxin